MKQAFYIPFSGAVRVDFKSKPLPYIVKIKGVPSGAIFELNKEFYVVGDKGIVSVEAEGPVKIPMDNGEVCDLNITKKQKEYVCTVKEKENVKTQTDKPVEENPVEKTNDETKSIAK